MITTMVKDTPLSQLHSKLGAKMAAFAGYNMPISYSGINDEHQCVRTKVGVFDVSHMGEFILKGENAIDLLQRITTNDVSKLTPGKAQYSCMTNEHGGIVDDLLVYRLGDKEWMMVVNASNIQKDWDWTMRHNDGKVEAHDISDKTALLAVQGPLAMQLLQQLADTKLADIPYYSFAKGNFAGVDNVLMSNTGYTGAGGFELYFEKDNAERIWNKLFEIGAPLGLKPIGLAARDTLRLEMGFCLYGNDIDDTTTPLEAGLGWITKFAKDFTARSILEKQKADGVKRKLVGFEMVDRGIPRHDYEIADANGRTIGKVTSGTQSPSLSKAIGMGYVNVEHAKPDSEIFIRIRDNSVKAKVVKLPFYNAAK
jgi:aminomethyltransferase